MLASENQTEIRSLTQEELEELLIRDIAGFSEDPLGFVEYGFPWGEEGTLEKKEILAWQRETLEDVRDGVISVQEAIEIAEARDEEADIQPYQDATKSGHGIGKSALVSWLVLWAVCTFEDTRGVVTAGTDTQLKTKTIAELSKWYQMLICKHWFIQTTTAIYSADPNHAKTWRIDFIPWSEKNPDAFAGLHNEGKRILIVMDEASQIPKVIHETIQGALTDKNTQILWFMFGNPTKKGTPFFQCFNSMRHRWNTRTIDSRDVEITNKAKLNAFVEDYGEDSDFTRVRVKGQFPRAGSTQFIANDLVEAARKREVEANDNDPFVVMVDVARFGDDESVIGGRRGRDARSVPWLTFRGIDTMELASEAAKYARENNARAIFVDGTGVGGGVVDRLRQLELPVDCVVYDVEFGSGCNGAYVIEDKNVRLGNHVAEMWYLAREWLKVGAIPNSQELEDELTGREYGFNAKDEIILEKKKDMKKRGLSSPDRADTLALSFHVPVTLQVTVGRKPRGSKSPLTGRRRR